MYQCVDIKSILLMFNTTNYSVQFSCSVVSDSLQPHESQHARPPCPSPTPRVHSDSCPSLCNRMDCSLPGSSVHEDSPGKNTGVGCHALLQGIFLTQRSNPRLPHCRQILYCVSHQGSLIIPIHRVFIKRKFYEMCKVVRKMEHAKSFQSCPTLCPFEL